MKGLIPSSYYHDEEVLRLENERVFGRAWHFAGFTFDLANDNDYVTLEVAGKSIVVQNFAGKLRAFLNVCSHRFSEIRCEQKGNGPLRCPYHGWTYDGEGLPTGIPHRPRFEDLTPDCVRSLALKAYHLERCGELIFVCLDGGVPDLRSSFGDFFDDIEELSRNFGVLIDTSEWQVKCNWKILIENTLEAYHVGTVHPKTFAKLNADFGDFRFDSLGSSFLGKTDMQHPSVSNYIRSFSSRTCKAEGYFHFSLFPTFLMSTSYGIVSSVQQIRPICAGKTFMKSFIFHRKPDVESKVNSEMMTLLRDFAISFNRQVLAEDQRACESVQAGARQVDSVGMLSDEEQRILEFHRTYGRFVATPGAGQ